MNEPISLYKDTYEELLPLERERGFVVRDPETHQLYRRFRVRELPKIYEQLMKISIEDMNLPCIVSMEKVGNEFEIIEKYTDGIPLKEKIDKGLSPEEFEDIVLQLISAARILAAQKPPIFCENLSSQLLLVDEDGIVHLTTFDCDESTEQDVVFGISKILHRADNATKKKLEGMRVDSFGDGSNLDELFRQFSRHSRKTWITAVGGAAVFFIAMMRVGNRLLPLFGDLIGKLIEAIGG